MRRMIFLAIGLFLFSISSFAQEVIYPKAEVFGGFSISSIPGVASFDPTTGLPTSSRKSFKGDRKSTRLNSSHDQISYAVFCLKKKKKHKQRSIYNKARENL